MLRLDEGTKIYVANQSVDGRKAINGLSACVEDIFSDKPKEDAVYVFYNKYKTQVKCLVWHKNGFVLHQKRLGRGRFKLLFHEKEGCTAISANQFGC